jgi:hypothetical protein
MGTINKQSRVVNNALTVRVYGDPKKVDPKLREREIFAAKKVKEYGMKLLIRSGQMYEIVDDVSGRTTRVYSLWATEAFIDGIQFAFESRNKVSPEISGLWKDD